MSVVYSSLKSKYLASRVLKNPTLGGLAQDIDALDVENDEMCRSNPLAKKFLWGGIEIKKNRGVEKK